MFDRQTIRQNMRRQRQLLTEATRADAASAISRYIVSTAWFLRSQRIAFYYAVNGEVDPFPLMQRAWQMGKNCYLPICHPLKSSLLFARYSPGDPVIINRYGIIEPLHKRHLCKPWALDLVFTPLIAFDSNGNRLGSGMGYYDQTFAYTHRLPAACRPLLVGLAYDFQQVEQLTPKHWDVALDEVVVCG